VTCITSSDLSKAFDCVDRSALLTKLRWYGVSTHWLENYFKDRTQTVKGGIAVERVDFGVVQGSTLGPILFNVFTNDLTCHLSNRCKLVFYADDAMLLHNAPPTEEGLANLKSHVESDLVTLSTWFKSNGLKANPDKTVMTVVGTATSVKKSSDLKINFNGVELKPAETVQFLGVLIDQKLTMEKQTSRVLQRCYGSLVTLHKLSPCLPSSTMKHLIQALAFPHVTYCLPAWAPPTQVLRKRVDKMLNFAIRIVTRRRRTDRVSNAGRALGWLTFEETIKHRDCALMHKIIHKANAPQNLASLVTYRADISERSTRATDNDVLHTERCDLVITQKTVPVRAVYAWNELPTELRRNASARALSKGVKASILSKPQRE